MIFARNAVLTNEITHFHGIKRAIYKKWQIPSIMLENAYKIKEFAIIKRPSSEMIVLLYTG